MGNRPAVNEPGQSPGVFVLLPVLNEKQNIDAVLNRIEATLSYLPHTIGILDDGSLDGTVEYLQERVKNAGSSLHLICRRKAHRGSQRGSALRLLMIWGLENTGHEVFVEMDADLSHRPEEMLEGIRLVAQNQNDVAIASKYLPESRVINRPWVRRLVSRVCSVAVGVFISPGIVDYSNGFRFYRRSAAAAAAGYVYRYGSPIYLTEILSMWLRDRLRIVEFPTCYVGRNEGISKLRILDLVKAAIAVMEISVRYHFLGFKLVAADQQVECQHSRAAGQ